MNTLDKEDRQMQVEDVKTDVAHLEQGNDAKRDNVVTQAMEAEAADIQMSFREAVRTHKAAVFWSVMVSMCVVMESYDLCLWGNLLAMPAFREHYGHFIDDVHGYQLDPAWQTGVQQSSTVGAFVGILICGQIVEPLGYRKTTLVGLVLMIAFIFITFFAETIPVLMVGNFLCGIPWGFFINIAPAYASEVAPISLRGLLTIYVQICWCIGQFVASGVTFGTQSLNNRWAYKIPFAVQWAWPVPLFCILWFAPESPWWLVRKGRLEEAERTVARLGGASNQSPKDTVEYIIRTNELEQKETQGATFMDCFRGSELRRTAIACLIFAFHNFTGNVIGNQATYFFQQAGLPVESAFALGLGNVALQMVCVFACWILTAYYGRRTLYLFGVGFNAIFLLAIGIAASFKRTTASVWVQAVFMILVYAQYGLTIGPITYAVIAETSSVKLRAKTVGLSRNFYYIWSVTMGVITGYMLNPAAWDLAGKSAYVFAATSLVVWFTAYFGLPEMKGRSYRELDILFHRKVSARKFASTKIDGNEEE